jgi:hypothetical protein
MREAMGSASTPAMATVQTKWREDAEAPRRPMETRAATPSTRVALIQSAGTGSAPDSSDRNGTSAIISPPRGRG